MNTPIDRIIPITRFTARAGCAWAVFFQTEDGEEACFTVHEEDIATILRLPSEPHPTRGREVELTKCLSAKRLDQDTVQFDFGGSIDQETTIAGGRFVVGLGHFIDGKFENFTPPQTTQEE
jgi:hypothetical protein